MSGHTSGLLHFSPWNRVNAQPDKKFFFLIKRYVQLKAFFCNAEIAKVANLAKTKKQIDNLQHLYPGLKGLAKICCETEAVNKAKKGIFQTRDHELDHGDSPVVHSFKQKAITPSASVVMKCDTTSRENGSNGLIYRLPLDRGNACVYFIEV